MTSNREANPPPPAPFEPEAWVPDLPPRDRTGHKGTSGRLLIVGASPGLTGAVDLAQGAALRVGAGLVTCAVPETLREIFEIKTTEAMTLGLPEADVGHLGPSTLPALRDSYERSDAIVLGPGLGRAAATTEFVAAFLRLHDAEPRPLVIDADGLFHLAEVGAIGARSAAATVVTPHPGELARLGRTVAPEADDPPVPAGTLAERWPGLTERFPVTWVLKGPGVFDPADPANWVFDPDGSRTRCPTGNPGLATGGSGDVLAGVIGGWLAQGFSPADASRLGLWVHGRAADLAAYGDIARNAGRRLGRPEDWPRTCDPRSPSASRGERGLLPSDVRDALSRAVLELERWHAHRLAARRDTNGPGRDERTPRA